MKKGIQEVNHQKKNGTGDVTMLRDLLYHFLLRFLITSSPPPGNVIFERSLGPLEISQRAVVGREKSMNILK